MNEIKKEIIKERMKFSKNKEWRKLLKNSAPLSKRRIENQNDSSPKDKEPKEQDHWPDSPAQNMEDSMPPPEESSGDLHEDAAEQQPSKRNDQQPGTPKIIKAESEGEGKTSPKIHSFKNPLHI